MDKDRRKYVFISIVMIILFGGGPMFGQNSHSDNIIDEAEELFMNNKTEDALIQFRTALEKDPGNEKLYIYIGIAYEQLGMYESAIDILRQGMLVSNEKHEVMYHNIANNLIALGDSDGAAEMFAKAIEVKASYAPPYLNRANLQVKSSKYEEAIQDYTQYLRLEPTTPQRGNIIKVIDILRQKMVAEEKAKIEEERRQREEAEKQKLEEERRRLEEDRRRREEEVRQQRLLESVLKSLETSTKDKTDLSAGRENIDQFEDEFELAD